MGDDKKVEEWMENHDGDDYCAYCIHSGDCSGMAGGPTGPIYPLCCDSDFREELLDVDALLEDLKSEEA